MRKPKIYTVNEKLASKHCSKCDQKFSIGELVTVKKDYWDSEWMHVKDCVKAMSYQDELDNFDSVISEGRVSEFDERGYDDFL